MSRPLRDVLPPLYRPLLSSLFDEPEVVETRANCIDCTMCDKGEGAPVGMLYFRPDTKCCTYHPFLANFLVGAILADESPELAEGRRRIREKIASRIGVTPHRIAPPRKHTALVSASQDFGIFGRTKSLLCPYYSEEKGGQCTIWRHRDSICSTFFCKYTGGQRGWAFWSALKEYLGVVEIELARQAVEFIDPTLPSPPAQRGKLTVEDLEDRGPNDDDYAKLWGNWVGREEEFFLRCHESVRSLDRARFGRGIDGGRARKQLDALAKRYHELVTKALPLSLRRNPKMIETHVDGAVVVITYNANDSFKVDKDLYDALALLDPQKTLAENLADLERQHGIELAPELIEYLYLHGVLVAPTPAKSPDLCQTTD